MTKIGLQSWRENHEDNSTKEMENENHDTEENTDNDKNSEEWIWTPEKVVGAIEKVLSHGAHDVRRARWFCRIRDSILIWKPKENAGNLRHVLFLENGKAAFSMIDSNSVRSLFPVGYIKHKRERQRCFDVRNYDRMLVLTTEIRRLVSKKVM